MKHILFAAALLLSSLSAFAQYEVGTITIQPKVGMNVSSLNKLPGTSMRVGFTAGVEAEYQVWDIISVSVGAVYSQQGYRHNYKSSFEGELMTDMSERYNMDYINIPILANVYVADGLAVKAGIQPGFCVSHKYREKNNITGRLQKGDIETLDRKFDLAIPVGLSYELPNGVTFDARYNIGLLKAIREYQESGRYKVGYNSVFQLTIGYKFVL